MDKVDRAKYKQLANDAIIAHFGQGGETTQLAEALEKCVEWMDDVADKCETCSTCSSHGDHYKPDEVDLLKAVLMARPKQ